MNGGSVAFILFGGAFLVIATVMGRAHKRFLDRAAPVRLRVVDTVRRVRHRRSDEASSVSYRSVYEVLTGPHAGRRGTDRTGSGFKPPAKGTELDGWFDPADGSVTSRRNGRVSQFAFAGLMLVGAALVVGGLVG